LRQNSLSKELNQEIISCTLCPRLVKWRAKVAEVKRTAYQNEDYWGKPITGFGDPNPEVFIIGLAPGAHGANRTGRIFTGDRSGQWLYSALYRAGFSNKEESVSANDGLKLKNAYISLVVRCVPPQNKPKLIERDRCLPYLVKEIKFFSKIKILIALGIFAFDGILLALKQMGHSISPKPKFKHGLKIKVGPYWILCSYHPSQQNTFTGRLTKPMFEKIFTDARKILTKRNHPGNSQKGIKLSPF